MENKPKLYVGRPIDLYLHEEDKKKDAVYLECIRTIFPDFILEDPSQQKHSDGYARYRKMKGQIHDGQIVTSGMDYYFREVLPLVKAGAFLPFRDGMFGKGVYGEAEFIFNLGNPTFVIDFDWQKMRVANVRDFKPDLSKCLSVEQTQSRIYIDGDYNRIKSFFVD